MERTGVVGKAAIPKSGETCTSKEIKQVRSAYLEQKLLSLTFVETFK